MLLCVTSQKWGAGRTPPGDGDAHVKRKLAAHATARGPELQTQGAATGLKLGGTALERAASVPGD